MPAAATRRGTELLHATALQDAALGGCAVSGLRLIPLGTAGWFPTHGKQTACYLVEMAGCRLLLDAGTGLARLGEGRTGAASDGEPSGTTGPLPEGSRLHVFLTHYHLDHVVGLTYLPALAPGATVHLHGPSPRITGIGLHEALERLFGMPLFSTPVDRLPLTLTLHELDEGVHRIDGIPWPVVVERQPHPGGSVRYRFGDALAYVSDAAADMPREAAFAAGVRVLLREAWGEREAHPPETWESHADVDAAASIARQAGVGALYLIHLHPLLDRDGSSRLVQRARRTFPRTFLAEELRVIRVEA